ncbi:TAXI family TRAP transporter solute-binding subunit [Actinomadura barringtoniae]|uniref:TAXI family TRAP transporter solute-binding subunit n=1 Tax=Actinomadura barringtoniae TaxID=1427535 RepID=A0A939T3P9_9ACTN|nr:TAXI family TRAP transporter solute-binding subunit [Actinomadura barringtoniae]MBO2451476.1 TAXI family TRAP transporter solute-binding subunit [Actinomadura barringtoniae]
MAVLALAVTVAAVLVGCDSEPPVRRLIVASGGEGGVYHALGTAFGVTATRRWRADVRVLTTAASAENLRMLADRRADVGFATVDTAALALRGDPPFTGKVPVAALAGLYDDYLQIVVPADGPLRSVGDLRGRRVSTGAPGSGTEIVAERVLGAAGIDIDKGVQRRRWAAARSSAGLADGEIDAFFFTGGLPTPAIAELAATHKIRILSLGRLVGELQRRYGDVYLARTIPGNTYALGEEVTTIGIVNVLAVRADMDPAEAEALTELLFDEKRTLIGAHTEARRIDQRTALVTFPVPLHPGAVRYYRRSKVLSVPQGDEVSQGKEVSQGDEVPQGDGAVTLW